MSRADDDPEGTPVARRVVVLIHNFVPLLDLRVAGRLIRTSAEHPFWARGRGWTAAHQLRAGDELLADGRWVAVEAVVAGGVSAAVHNVQVEEYHTYFVGEAAWGFSLWSHNLSCQFVQQGEKMVLVLKDVKSLSDQARKQLKTVVRAWNDQIKKFGGSMKRQHVTDEMRKAGDDAIDALKAKYPSRFAEGQAGGHVPDMFMGNNPDGKIMAMSTELNKALSTLAAKTQDSVGTAYNRVRIGRGR